MPAAYVYITLPGATQAVTAGRFEHTVERSGPARVLAGTGLLPEHHHLAVEVVVEPRKGNEREVSRVEHQL